MKEFILVLDAGTSGVKALVVRRDFSVVARCDLDIGLFSPSPDAVEQDADEIYKKCIRVCSKAIQTAGIDASEILCMSITTQRGSGVFWDKDTGEPLRSMISWQDSRTLPLSMEIRRDGWAEKLKGKSIVTDGTLSLKTLCRELRENPLIKDIHRRGKLMFGNIDTWLIFRLTGGRVYTTTYSGASMFGGFDFSLLDWNEDFLGYLGVPSSLLPGVVFDCCEIGYTEKDIFGVSLPILSNMADQQSATFAHRVLESGMAKCTCGTGGFVDLCVGKGFITAPEGMFSMATCITAEDSVFQIEGCIKTAGAVFKWLRDRIKLISDYDEIEPLAASVNDSDGVLFLPALAGLGAPGWETDTFGFFAGLKASTTREHMIRAALQGIAFRIRELCEIMANHTGEKIKVMYIDGGLCASDAFCSIVADATGISVLRPKIIDATALGAAEMAGLYSGFWSESEVRAQTENCDSFFPGNGDKADELYRQWWSIRN